jgi:hypothetical protein
LNQNLEAEESAISRFPGTHLASRPLGHYIGLNIINPDKRQVKELVAQINDNNLGKDYSVRTLREFKVSPNNFYEFFDDTEKNEPLDFIFVAISEKDKPESPRTCHREKHVSGV